MNASYYIAPASDPTDRYSANYDGNAFPSRAAAEAEIEKLRRISGEFCIDWIVVAEKLPGWFCAADGEGPDGEHYPEETSARAAARKHVDGGEWGDPETRTEWVPVRCWRQDADGDRSDETDVMVALHPDEPECSDDHSHEWAEVAVYGHGGGARIVSACPHCDWRRTDDTWATDPATGTQGLRSVEYSKAGRP